MVNDQLLVLEEEEESFEEKDYLGGRLYIESEHCVDEDAFRSIWIGYEFTFHDADKRYLASSMFADLEVNFDDSNYKTKEAIISTALNRINICAHKSIKERFYRRTESDRNDAIEETYHFAEKCEKYFYNKESYDKFRSTLTGKENDSEYDKKWAAWRDSLKPIIKPLDEWSIIRRTIKTESYDNIGEVYQEIVDKLLNDNTFITIAETNRDIIYVYQNGIYYELGNKIISDTLEANLGKHCKTSLVNEVTNKIARSTRASEIGNVDPNYLCLENGIYDVGNNELIDFDSRYQFMSKVPVSYNPEAKCPQIMKFLNETFEAEDIPIIQEWLGFLLYRDYFIKKAIVLVGPKNTGKSTFMNLVNAFIGKQSISNVALQDIWNKNKRATLRYKLCNSYDELSPNDVQDIEAFKMVTGRSEMSGEFKFKDEIRFYNYAKMQFACNNFPIIKKQDDAFWDRWLIIGVNNVVEQTALNPNLLKEMTTPEEMSGLLNFALEGLDRLMKENQFSYYHDSEWNEKLLSHNADSVYTFCSDILIRIDDSNSWISKRELYDAFCAYAKKNQMRIIGEIAFGRRFSILRKQKYAYIIETRKSTDDSRSDTGWSNVKLNN